jgi:hypothetical protein
MRKQSVASVACAAALVVACGSEPKKEPTAATAAPSEPAPPASAAASAAPASSAAAPEAAKPDKQAECKGLADEATLALDTKRIEFDKGCKKDSDCLVVKGRACAFHCPNGAIPKADEKAWNDAVAKAKDGSCKKWTDNDCAKLRTTPEPTCEDKKAWCEKGRCALK